jgi:hypothetical protein
MIVNLEGVEKRQGVNSDTHLEVVGKGAERNFSGLNLLKPSAPPRLHSSNYRLDPELEI